MKQLDDAEFSAEKFDAQTLLECDHDQKIHAGRSLFVKLVPLSGRRDLASHAIADLPKGYHTVSPQYPSAESEADSENSIKIQPMPLLPSGAAFIRERMLLVKTEVRSTIGPKLPDIRTSGSGQFKSYPEAAIRKYEHIKPE